LVPGESRRSGIAWGKKRGLGHYKQRDAKQERKKRDSESGGSGKIITTYRAWGKKNWNGVDFRVKTLRGFVLGTHIKAASG